jgi:hypothetical protein
MRRVFDLLFIRVGLIAEKQKEKPRKRSGR